MCILSFLKNNRILCISVGLSINSERIEKGKNIRGSKLRR